MKSLKEIVNEKEIEVVSLDLKYKVISIVIIIGLLIISYWLFHTEFFLVSWVYYKVINFIAKLLGMILGVFG